MKQYLTTAFILFVLASAVIVPVDFVLAAQGREPFAPQGVASADPKTGEPHIQAIIKDGLLWWLNRDGPNGGYSFEDFINTLGGIGEHFHHGPSRGGAR